MDPTIIDQIVSFLSIVYQIRLVLLSIVLYIIISIWYNTRRTKINTDRIVSLLEVYMHEKMTSANKKELIYGPTTLSDAIMEKNHSKKYY